MALIENFYNNDRARDIREILTQNFANVARYIPNNFLTLTTIERQNLTDDYKDHFKLVFDSERRRVYRWSNIQRNWEMYLIYAWDDYARKEANANAASAFVSVELGVDENGTEDPYTFTFYNRGYTETDGNTGQSIYHPPIAKDSISLTALNVKYNENYSVSTIIDKLIADLTSLDDFVGNRDDILENPDLSSTTVCSAIKEINSKTIDNKTRLDNIMSGVTPVPEAIHAQHADLADIATLARDSELFGGQLPSYYAKQSDLTATSELLGDTINRVEANESNIALLQNITTATDTHLQALDDREAEHFADYEVTAAQVRQNSSDIGQLSENVELMNNRIGWQVVYA